MVPTPSRRAVLAGAGSGLVGLLAGCTTPDSRSPPSEDGVLVTDYTVEITRSRGDRPPVVASVAEPDDTDERPERTAEPVDIRTIRSERAATALDIRSDATNATGARRLLDETSYANQSVIVYQTPIGECYRLKVDYLAKEPDGSPDLDFCRVIRDAHTACERASSDYAAALVRLPWPGSEFDGFSVGSGGDCGPIPPEYRTGSETA